VETGAGNDDPAAAAAAAAPVMLFFDLGACVSRSQCLVVNAESNPLDTMRAANDSY